jgi:hypothetical protein
MADAAVDAELAVALDRIVRLDLPDHAVHARHGGRKIDGRPNRTDAIPLQMSGLVHHARALDQRFRRHAARVQAVSAHAFLFDQRDSRLHGGANVSSDEPRGASADDDLVAVEMRRLRPAAVYRATTDEPEDAARDPRKQREQQECTDQIRRQQAAERLELRDLRARIHVDDRAGKQAGL